MVTFLVKQRSFFVLHRLWLKRDLETPAYLSDISEEFDFDQNLLASIEGYLIENSLIEYDGLVKSSAFAGDEKKSVRITEEGINALSEADSTPNEPTKYFPPFSTLNFYPPRKQQPIVNNNFGNVIYAGEKASFQIQNVPSYDEGAFRELLTQLKEHLKTEAALAKIQTEALTQIAVIEEQLSSKHPDKKLITRAGNTLERVLTPVGGAAGIISMLLQLTSFLSYFRH